MPTLTEVMQSAVNAESSGVPVDWRSLAINMHNAVVQAAQEQTDGAVTDPQKIADIMEREQENEDNAA